MKRFLCLRPAQNRRATASIEFSLICPVLLILFGGAADFGLLIWVRHRLASGVTQGAEYAFNMGANASANSVKSVVVATSSLPTAQVTVTGPACYCISGTPATMTPQTCGNVCTDGTIPGKYVSISANYTYEPIIPSFSQLTSSSITQLATVRVQ